ncbi:hypothetical protein K523DRAFT_422327 [Schizophyllum commune Tattone D]|nr:hypothetical protein K523DRAFT_422327 [Schizophyllum commune Tattone D]
MLKNASWAVEAVLGTSSALRAPWNCLRALALALPLAPALLARNAHARPLTLPLPSPYPLNACFAPSTCRSSTHRTGNSR